MQNIKSFLLILCLIPNLAMAKKFAMGLGGFFNSKSLFRGAETWPKPSIMAGPSFTFYERVSVKGPSVDYSFLEGKSPFSLAMGIRLHSDGEPLISLGSHEEDYRNQRSSTFEFQTSFSYKFRGFSGGVMLAKDLDETKSLYSELKVGAPAYIKFLSLEYLIGIGEKGANQYSYGPTAVSGAGWQKFSLNYLMLNLPWDGVIINSASYSKVLQGKNKTADFVRSNDGNFVFSTIIVWNII
jgi:hypothetical protein